MELFLVVGCLFMAFGGILGSNPIVQVEQGKLLGTQEKTITGVEYYSFKGIPYAKPPIKELRFKAPQAPESWNGVRNATEHGSECPQMVLVTSTYHNNSEDCLFTNVYSPNLTPKTPYPVICVVHGGANKFGSGNTAIYGPDFLVQDAVIVTFNYRLDTLGTISLGTCDVPGNAGLKDQVAVLKWIKTNIHNFGGDPNSVTLLGDTYGGTAVTYHLISPASKGLFHKAIAMSGSIFSDFAAHYLPERRALVQAQSLGYNGTTPAELLKFLQEVRHDKLINTSSANAAILASEVTTLLPFKMLPFTGPVVEKKCPEGNFLTEEPLDILKSGQVNKADVMFSYSSNEAVTLINQYESQLIPVYERYPELFAPVDVLINSPDTTKLEVSKKVIEYYFKGKEVSVNNIREFISYSSNASIVFPMQRFCKLWPNVGNKYVFKFSSYTTRNYYGQLGAKYGIEGAAHFDVVYYLNDPKSLNLPFDINGKAYKIIKLLTESVINFAKTGKPTTDESQWPQYTSSNPASVNIKDNMTVEYDADGEDYEFWKSIFDFAKIRME